MKGIDNISGIRPKDHTTSKDSHKELIPQHLKKKAASTVRDSVVLDTKPELSDSEKAQQHALESGGKVLNEPGKAVNAQSSLELDRVLELLREEDE